MKIASLFFLLTISGFAKAQEYDALFIPDSLLKGATVVNRDEEYILTIKSSSKYTLYERHVYTILNEGANEYAGYKTFYDKFCNINFVTGKMFNLLGKEIKHTKKSEWTDNSAYDGFSLLSDARYKKNEFYSSDYPYTIEYEEEDDYDGTQSFPGWMPQRSPLMSVQNSKFTVIAPADYILRYKKINFNGDPAVTQKGDVKTYTWEIKNIRAKKNEASAPPFSEITPVIYFAPSKFEVQGYSGEMSTWKGYGDFMYQLIKGRDVLPEEIKTKVHELTDNIKSDTGKIFALYKFLQQNTRYISIQLGIGGWQPFEASYVAEKKYGDCKALSNYMIALLKEAGIAGKYVEIYGGSSPPPLVEDFSFSQFNHVIVCVPLQKDTVWLECTSQTVSPGYMGSFTGNRKALLIDETGGHVVQTPCYNIDDNVRLRKVTAIADEQGNLNAEISNKYTGLQQNFPHALMYEASKTDRDKYLNQMFNLPTYEVTKSEYEEHKGIVPSVNEHLQIQLNNYAILTGRRLFITPNIFGEESEKLLPNDSRQYDYVIRDAYRNIDSVEIKIPVGYKPESVPKDISLETEFGKYISTSKVLDNKIIYYRLMERYNGRFAAKKFNELVSFYEQCYNADRKKIVLIKNDE